MPKNPKFNLDYQYALYLKRIKLDEATMHEEQKRQLKQAFYGACGQLLVLFRDDVAALSEREAVGILESLHKQTVAFWENELRNLK
ncbi:hypothetical protein [Spirosoma radiotolerans]|uniref:Uncharacterized protein n=1 Tax=Spirosoma radiotolerans TaxID=1379870 RepID=A0A0E3ZVH7_9BACT|nr:hypothetical protein [Spirosoma radiotolerans]AKD55049.1 hypothetical protein SD10_09160 [Spirosoma radiotolerans]